MCQFELDRSDRPFPNSPPYLKVGVDSFSSLQSIIAMAIIQVSV